ncbi:MAG: QueT transporter family protein [Dysosmobacter sp.]
MSKFRFSTRQITGDSCHHGGRRVHRSSATLPPYFGVAYGPIQLRVSEALTVLPFLISPGRHCWPRRWAASWPISSAPTARWT